MTISQDVATYAVLAMQSYDFMDEDKYSLNDIKKTFPLSDVAFRGWEAVNNSDAGTLQFNNNGFNAEIFTNGSEYVISLRGTDDWDWAEDGSANASFVTGSISTQLQHAVAYVEAIIKSGVPLDQITFVGHSLGGGLASALAALYDRPAYVFDPAPVNLNIDTYNFVYFTEGLIQLADSYVTDSTLEALIGTARYSETIQSVSFILSLLADIANEPLLSGMAAVDWATVAPENRLQTLLPNLPAQPMIELASVEEMIAWTDGVSAFETALRNRYLELETKATQNVSSYAIKDEVLQVLMSSQAQSVPSNNGTELIDVGPTDLTAVDLHDMSLLALTMLRSEDGANIVTDLFYELPGLVDNLFNDHLSGFENHKNELDHSIFLRMLMEQDSGFYEEFFTAYKKAADAEFSDGRNSVSEYFIQSGLIELGERVRQDTDNNYRSGDLSAPGEFFGVSGDYLYQQTFDVNSRVADPAVPFLEDYIDQRFRVGDQFLILANNYDRTLPFSVSSQGGVSQYAFNLYADFRAVAVASRDSGALTIDLQATMAADTESLETIAEDEAPGQKATQGWVLLGGETGADTVTGSDFADFLITDGGDDKIDAGKGDDVVFAGAGLDEIDGGEGNDILVGGAGVDTFFGSLGSDFLFGGDIRAPLDDEEDKADFSRLDQAFSVTFSADDTAFGYRTQVASLSGGALASTLYSIEKLLLSGQSDTVSVADLSIFDPGLKIEIDGSGHDQAGDFLDLSALGEGATLSGSSLQSGLTIDGTGLTVKNFEKLVLTGESDTLIMDGAADTGLERERIEISSGGGDDGIFYNNVADPQNSLTYGEERQQLKISTGDGDDWVHGSGAAEIFLGAGDDLVIASGTGSVIDLGPGGDEDRDSVDLSGARGTLLNGADGYDRVYAYSFLSTAELHLKHVDSESDYFYDYAGAVKLGLNVAGELMIGDIFSEDGKEESFIYVANFNKDILTAPQHMTAGVMLTQIDAQAFRLFELEEAISQVQGQGVWEWLVHALKQSLFANTAGGVDPLVLDLDGDGFELTSMATGVGPMFDMDGDGFAEYTGWVAPDDGLLVLDADGDGVIHDVEELFGGPEQSGFAELAEHDANADGKIDSADTVFADLRVWRDLDRDVAVDEGELFSLSDLGIASIDLAAADDGSWQLGNSVDRTGTFTFQDGSTGTVGDISFQVNNYETVYTGDRTVDPTVAATMPELKGRGTLADLQVSITLDGIGGALATTIEQVLPTLNVVDLEVLSQRAFEILSAWTDAPPAGQSFATNPDTPVLIDRANGDLTVRDFAVKVTEEITHDDGSTELVTYWKRAAGTPIKDANGNEIDYPTFAEVMAHIPTGDDASWGIISSQELTFMERYFGENIPIDQEAVLQAPAVSGLGEILSQTELLVKKLALRLALQGGLKDFFDGVEYSVETDSFIPTSGYELIPFFTKIFESAPLDAAGAQAWIDRWEPLVNTLLSDYDRPGGSRITEPFVFTTVVAAYETVGLPISLVAAAESLGVGSDITNYETGSRVGTDGNDIFYMSSGDDFVESKSGSDVFVFGNDFGYDVIRDYESGIDGFDTIRFAHLTPDDIVATRDGKDLLLTVTATGDAIRVIGQFNDIGYSAFGGQVTPHEGIEEIVFANGDVWGMGEIAMAVSHPLDSDDTLIGTDHGDILDGGKGNDYLSGGSNFDIYIFDKGYGHDTIYDNLENILSVNDDLLIFGENLKREDISFQRIGDSDDLIINTVYGDSLTIEKQFSGTQLFFDIWLGRIEFFHFRAEGNEGASFDYNYVMDELLRQAKTDGADDVYGFARDDVLDGGKGDDYLSGGSGSDTYIFGFGYGTDYIYEGTELDLNLGMTDRIALAEGVAESDVSLSRIGDSKDLTINLSDGSNVTIEKQFLGDNIAGNHYFALETIEFKGGAVWDQEYIYNALIEQSATSGDDEIFGFWRDDALDGGSGDDYLDGGDGDDTYIWGFGYGHDTIYDHTVSVFTGDADRLLFSPGVTLEDLQWERSEDDRNLIISLADGSTLTIVDQFMAGNMGHRHFDIEIFELSDGSIISLGQIQEALLTSTSGDDHLRGFFSDDVLDGGAGDDRLEGGNAGDTYVFGLGYGHDVIHDYQSSAFNDNPDRVLLKEGITVDGTSVTRGGGQLYDLILGFPGSEDTLTIEDYFSFDFFRIEYIIFSDGTVWDYEHILSMVTSILGTEFGESLVGSHDPEAFYAGKGDDLIQGGAGDDAFFYFYGDGDDTILENFSEGTSDSVILGQGILESEVAVSRSETDPNDMILTFSDGGSITLDQQFQWVAEGTGVENIVFANGTEWTHDTLRDLYLTQASTAADDVVRGFSDYADIIDSGDGDDQIYGLDGNDQITGGLGNDLLEGGGDDDTYYYALGDGADTITENFSKGTEDRLVLGDTILAAEVGVSRGETDPNDIILTFIDGGSVTLDQQFYWVSEGTGVENIVFADGTVWTHDTLRDLYLGQTSTIGDDIIHGFSDYADTIDGGDGDDEIYSLDGDDQITGGLGDDLLNGGHDDDIYHYALGDGADTITEIISSGTDDRLLLSGILSSEVSISRSETDFNDMILTFTDGGSITLDQQFQWVAVGTGVESIVFANGAVWTHDTLRDLYLGQTSTIGDDVIRGFSDYADIIDGGAGHDTIYGLDGDDQITGGLGNDLLNGGYDDDTYHYALGDGADTITEIISSGTDDRLLLSGILSSEVSISRSETDFDDMILTFTDGGSITLDQQFQWVAVGTGVENIVFADGTVWTHDTLRDFYLVQSSTIGDDVIYGFSDYADIIDGEAGDDMIYGLDGDDQITGGLGDDLLSGGYDDDTYHYALGDGDDTITELYTGNSLDRLVFGSGIQPAEVIAVRASAASSDVTLLFSDGGSLLLKGQLDNQYGNGLEEFAFADGTIWTKADLEAWVVVNQAPVALADQIIVNGGSQTSIILASDLLANDSDPDGDGLSIASVANASHGTVALNSSGDVVFTPPLGFDGIATFDYWITDGIFMTISTVTADLQSIAPAPDWIGTSGADTRWLSASEFVADGGLGDDDLIGNEGDSVFLWRKGDGNDTFGEQGGIDEVRFIDVLASEVSVGVSPVWDTHVAITIIPTGEVLTLTDQLGGSVSSQIERLVFSDNTVWQLADLSTEVLASQQTAANDVLRGYTDQPDTFIFNASFGHDRIADFEAGAAGSDIIEFQSAVFADYAAVIAVASDDGVDATIAVDANNSIALTGVVVSDLHQDDFRFV